MKIVSSTVFIYQLFCPKAWITKVFKILILLDYNLLTYNLPIRRLRVFSFKDAVLVVGMGPLQLILLENVFLDDAFKSLQFFKDTINSEFILHCRLVLEYLQNLRVCLDARAAYFGLCKLHLNDEAAMLLHFLCVFAHSSFPHLPQPLLLEIPCHELSADKHMGATGHQE